MSDVILHNDKVPESNGMSSSLVQFNLTSLR